MSLSNNLCRGAFALIVAVSAAACGDDAPAGTECGAGTTDVNGTCTPDTTCGAGTTLTNGECVGPTCGAGTMLVNGMCVTDPDMTTYRQVEQLGRPGIAEALIITPAFLEGYNATAPSFAGAPPAAVAAISAEVKTVLKAIFHGVCLLNGVAGLTAANGAQPGNVPCAQVGGNVFVGGSPTAGTTIEATQATAAQTYADKVFGQFVTDVLRIDTAVDSAYFTGCTAGLPAGAPLLCGGRKLNDDVIDITYFYLLAGATVPTAATTPGPVQTQVVALVNDGVFFSSNNAQNSGIGLGTAPVASNPNQFHQACANCGPQAISTTFPYSAAPGPRPNESQGPGRFRFRLSGSGR